MDYLKSKRPYILIIILLISVAVFDAAVWGEKTKPVRVELKADQEAWFNGSEKLINLKILRESEKEQ